MEKRFLTFQHTPWEGPGIHLLQEEHPFLKAEKAAICQSIEEDRPYLGFCLGHQLLADSLGAKNQTSCPIGVSNR